MASSILFVDRDPGLAADVCRLLSSRGHSIRTCLGGLQCVETLKEFAPGLLVLDPEVLWGGASGVLEWLICNESMIPPMVVVASDRSCPTLPDHLEPWVDLQIFRPQRPEDLIPFVSQLETLAWWSQSPDRDLEPDGRRRPSLAP